MNFPCIFISPSNLDVGVQEIEVSLQVFLVSNIFSSLNKIRRKNNTWASVFNYSLVLKVAI